MLRKYTYTLDLPGKLERKLAAADWRCRDVLVGGLRSKNQLAICKKHRFYHAPVAVLGEDIGQVRYVAIYQSVNLFGRKSGIRWYGEVSRCEQVARSEITQIPKDSADPYYLFHIRCWKRLPHTIKTGQKGIVHLFTTLFLLRNSRNAAELSLPCPEDLRLVHALRSCVHSYARKPEGPLRISLPEQQIRLENNLIRVTRGKHTVNLCSIADYYAAPLDILGYLQGA